MEVKKCAICDHIHSFTSYWFLRNTSSLYDELILKGKMLVKFYGNQDTLLTEKESAKGHNCIPFKCLILKYFGMLPSS